MSGYLYSQPTWGSWFVNTVTWVWSKTFGFLIEVFRTRMCVPTWTATILWLFFLGSLGTAIWGIVMYVTGSKPLTPTCAACPNSNKTLSGPVMLTPI